MWGRLFLFSAFFLVAVMAAETSTRPKNCPVGTTYAKDCNTCTCGANAKADKCSTFDCARAKSSTTPRTPSQTNPGVCPTKVTPRPGIDDCSKRSAQLSTSTCKIDKDCPGAKKCCANGCNVYTCRPAIYPNTP